MEFASDPAEGMSDPEYGLLELTDWHEADGQVVLTGQLHQLMKPGTTARPISHTTYVPQNFMLQRGQQLVLVTDRAQPDRVVIGWEASDPNSPAGQQFQKMLQVHQRLQELGEGASWFRKAKTVLGTAGVGDTIRNAVLGGNRTIPGGDPNELKGHAVTATVLAVADETSTDVLMRIPTTRLDVEVHPPGREPFPGTMRIKFTNRIAQSRAVVGAEVPVLLDPATPHVIILDVDTLAASQPGA